MVDCGSPVLQLYGACGKKILVTVLLVLQNFVKYCLLLILFSCLLLLFFGVLPPTPTRRTLTARLACTLRLQWTQYSKPSGDKSWCALQPHYQSQTCFLQLCSTTPATETESHKPFVRTSVLTVAVARCRCSSQQDIYEQQVDWKEMVLCHFFKWAS